MQKLILVVAFLIPGVLFAQAPVSKLGSGSVEERLEQLERVMDARNAAQMALLDQMSTLQDEVAQLRGKTEEHAYQLEQILQRQREIYQEIDRRLAATPAPSANVETSSSSPATTESTSTTSYSSNLGENDAYDKAIRLVMEDRRYDAAIPEFRSFIEQFPNSSYVPNAHYWLGQLLYAEGDFSGAKQEFSTVAERYPDSNKRADSLLKLGIVAQQQGEKQLAESYFEKVVADYPGSTPADLAAKRLENL